MSPNNSPTGITLTAQNVRKNFESLVIIDGFDFTISPGQFVVFSGPSGAGKSTALSILAGLETPSGGQVLWNNVDLATLSNNDRTKLRAKNAGFIFQNFRLIPTLTALENARLPLEILQHQSAISAASQDVENLLNDLQLGHRLHHYPHQMSGGECQRVAVARAFIHQPSIIFADEPTGNLDYKNAEIVMNSLLKMRQERGTSLLLVSHDPRWNKLADVVIRFADGTIRSQNESGS